MAITIHTISQFLRCRKTGEMPPPIPPKDWLPPPRRHANLQLEPKSPLGGNRNAIYQAGNMISAFANDGDRSRTTSEQSVYEKAAFPVTSLQYPLVDVPAKWATEKAPTDPEERKQRRMAEKRQRELEELMAFQEERERQERRRLEKEEQLRRERQEEAQRKAVLQEQLSLVASRRLQMEQDMRNAEKRQLDELRERKRVERERRIEHTRRLEQWRREERGRVELLAQQEEELRRQAKEEKFARSVQIVKSKPNMAELSSGWITLQMPNSVAWKRRFYKFDPESSDLFLYRSSQDTAQALHHIDLRGQVRRLCEHFEGYEELIGVPCSFALEFEDGQTWLAYADSDGEKEKFFGLIHQVAGWAL